MNIDKEDLFKYSYVITISDQKYKRITDYFTKAQLKPPHRFNGFQIQNRNFQKNLNCTISHIALIKMADTLNFPFICIYEDDAVPHKNILSLLNKYLTDIPDDTEVLKLGRMRVFANTKKLITDKFIKIKARGAQAYIVFKSGYKNILKYLYEKDCIIDMGALHLPHSYATLDNLFIQYNGEDSKHSSRGFIGIDKNMLKTYYKINPDLYQI